MKILANRLSYLALLALATAAGCASDGPFEEAGEEIDEAADEIEDELD